MTRDKGQQLLLAGVIVALVFVMFHFFGVTDEGYSRSLETTSLFRWMTNWWRPHSATGDDTPFGWAAPIISLWMVWRLRNDLTRAPRSPSWAGFVFVIAAIALHWIGARTQQTRISLAGFVLMTWAVPFHLFGWRVARLLAVPAAFLLFIIPLDFFDAFTTKLRGLSAVVSAGLLNGLGVEARVVDYTSVRLAPGSAAADFVLLPTAGGLRSASVILAAAIVNAWLRQRGLVRQIALVLCSPLILVAANVLFTTLVFMAVASGCAGAAKVFGSAAMYYLVVAALLTAAHALIRRGWRRPAGA